MEKHCEVDTCATMIPWGHFCDKHRKRIKRHGDPNVALRLWKVSKAERLVAYTDRSAGPDGCWPWTGAKSEHGYGVISAREGGTSIASRAAYEIANDVVLPREIDVMHLCNNPPCCNPAHLQAGTRAENQAYMAATGQSASGERNGNVKITDMQVAELRELRTNGAKLTELVERFGISPAQVSRIANGKRRSRAAP